MSCAICADMVELAYIQEFDTVISVKVFLSIITAGLPCHSYAPVVKLVYTMDLGSIPETGRGSSPLRRTIGVNRRIYKGLAGRFLPANFLYFHPHSDFLHDDLVDFLLETPDFFLLGLWMTEKPGVFPPS